jgi:hypothetical protein
VSVKETRMERRRRRGALHAQVTAGTIMATATMATRRRRVQQVGTGKKIRWRRLFWRRRKMGRVCWDAVVAQGERGAGG